MRNARNFRNTLLWCYILGSEVGSFRSADGTILVAKPDIEGVPLSFSYNLSQKVLLNREKFSMPVRLSLHPHSKAQKYFRVRQQYFRVSQLSSGSAIQASGPASQASGSASLALGQAIQALGPFCRGRTARP